MESEGKELGWDDSIKNDGQDFEPIPEGDYNVTVEKFERSRSKGEGKLSPCNMAVVYFTVHAVDKDISIRENYLLHTSMEWKLSELFCGTGLKEKGTELQMNWGELPGRKAKAKVGLKPGMKDPNKKFNYIEKLYPYETPKYTEGRF